jgi:hypothetical protein
MKEICLPYSENAVKDTVEVLVRNCSNKMEWLYRVEPVHVEEKETVENRKQAIINKLISYIKNYDNNWELLNIYDSEPKEGFIHILYRKRH